MLTTMPLWTTKATRWLKEHRKKKLLSFLGYTSQSVMQKESYWTFTTAYLTDIYSDTWMSFATNRIAETCSLTRFSVF